MWLARMPQLGLLLAALLQLAAAATPQAPLATGKYYYEADEAASALQAGRTRRIAIIGAGPSGTSAAYYLKRAQDRLASGNFSATTEALDITIYERENRIGGRVAVVYPHDDDTHDPIELGASIFADVNLNLRRAVKHFALETGAHMGMDGQMGIWDGQQFLFEGDQSSWWTSAKFFLRYGYSAITTESVVKKQLAAFGALYSPSFLHARGQAERNAAATASGYPWTSIERLADAVNASALAATTGMQFFKERRVSELFIEEMVEAATRVNYAQDTDQIHGFGALVSLAASGATGVKKGNYRIFEEFARRSGARVLTGVQGQVTGIVRLPKPTRGRRVANDVQWYVGAKSGEGEVYDAVIIATPWHNADITLLNTPERVKAKPFVHLHVTLLTTTRASPRPEYFGLGSQDVVPRTILTSDESVRRAQDKHKPVPEPEPEDPGTEPPSLGGKLKTPKHEFFSLNYLRSIERNLSSNKEKEYVVKIFSAAPVTDSMLDALFGRETLTWVRRHEWDSYPYLTPTERFPAVQIDEGLVYPNAMESLVSTMETSTIASRNAVALLLEKWYGAEFVHGSECSFEELKDPMDNPNWAGWGCDAA
ncbi:FAD/NAD(P)-binding domain-containing protein [Moesziomyces antarcticus]|uniref:FAD/NAD(P)-binding domain-containing protein n=2 Tax=Pseudozyma antarctica TaxID=84753 RepID=A0A081CHP6_PSEA2|nr:FAD/NAD(P)-binding domain-containing protein [Moesziomyces antarcticus]GAK66192.1 FAD/NAD(P)-binding domain-containing protein [Moesziomyces antarcticus]SPO49264.1 related to Prenylcysteine oxidase precursor [Moesziomyces antarcticus]